MAAPFLSLQVQHRLPMAPLFVARGGAIPLPGRKQSQVPPKKHIGNKIVELWYAIPMAPRFFASGIVGNLFLYVMENGIRQWMVATNFQPPFSIDKDAFSFFTAYMLQVIPQHLSHALLVYGIESINTAQKYWSTLFGTYQALIVSAVGSTFVNTSLVKMGVNRNLAFVSTLLGFACINFFWIGFVVSQAKKKDAKQRGGPGKVKQQPLPKGVRVRGGATICSLADDLLVDLDDLFRVAMIIPSAAAP